MWGIKMSKALVDEIIRKRKVNEMRAQIIEVRRQLAQLKHNTSNQRLKQIEINLMKIEEVVDKLERGDN